MSSTGNKFPTAAVNVDRAGNTAWTNPGNVVSDNATDATVVVPSDYLVTSGYDFSAVPDGAEIKGVTVRVEASESGSGTSDYIPQLHSDTTPTLIGSPKTAVGVSGTTKVISTTGSTSDLWGATLTPAIVKAAGFGVSIWSTDTVNTLAIDFVTIAIEYVVIKTGAVGFVVSGGFSEAGARLRARAVTFPAIASSAIVGRRLRSRVVAFAAVATTGWIPKVIRSRAVLFAAQSVQAVSGISAGFKNAVVSFISTAASLFMPQRVRARSVNTAAVAAIVMAGEVAGAPPPPVSGGPLIMKKTYFYS